MVCDCHTSTDVSAGMGLGNDLCILRAKVISRCKMESIESENEHVQKLLEKSENAKGDEQRCFLTYTIRNEQNSLANITKFTTENNEWNLVPALGPGEEKLITISVSSSTDCEKIKTGKITAQCANGGSFTIKNIEICEQV